MTELRKCARKKSRFSFFAATASLINKQEQVLENKFSALVQHVCTYFSNANFLVAMRLGGTPVPIPNTMVKT